MRAVHLAEGEAFTLGLLFWSVRGCVVVDSGFSVPFPGLEGLVVATCFRPTLWVEATVL